MSVRLTHALDQAILAALPGPMLVIGAQQPVDLVDMPIEGLVVQNTDFMATRSLKAAGIAVSVDATGTFETSFVFAARNREAWMAQMAKATSLTRPGGLILLDGAKSDGIEAIARAVAATGLTVETHAKAHGKLVWFTRPDALPEQFASWAEAGNLRKNTDEFLTAPGMFSHNQADAGSQLLLEHVPDGLSGKGADLGAGWGWLSAGILARNPAITQLHLLEADHAAIDAARINITDPRAQFQWTDATTPLGLKNLDLVIMNPPFHRHGATDPDLGRAFISSAASLLSPSGRLFMVANRQLPYEAVLEQRFAKVTTLAQTGIYKVITAERVKRRVA